MKETCFIVVHRNYADGADAYAFWNEEDARKSVSEDIDVTVKSLKESGYEVKLLERLDEWEVYVPDTDIYYEWSIGQSTIE